MEMKDVQRRAIECDRTEEIELAFDQICQAALALNQAVCGLRNEMRRASETDLVTTAAPPAPVPQTAVALPNLLSINEVVRWLGVSRTTFYIMRVNHEFPEPVNTSGRRRLFSVRDVERWLIAHREDS